LHCFLDARAHSSTLKELLRPAATQPLLLRAGCGGDTWSREESST
jgi:hypothetical protein